MVETIFFFKNFQNFPKIIVHKVKVQVKTYPQTKESCLKFCQIDHGIVIMLDFKLNPSSNVISYVTRSLSSN